MIIQLKPNPMIVTDADVTVFCLPELLVHCSLKQMFLA